MPNSLSSMTGFARQDGQLDRHRWTYELRSVNGRGLEVRCRLPAGFDALELKLRKAVTAKLARGNVSVSLTLRDDEKAGRLVLNKDALSSVLEMVKTVQEESPIAMAPPTVDGVLNIRGVIEASEETLSEDALSALIETLATSFDEALGKLIDHRRAEGASLQAILEKQIDAVEELTNTSRKLSEGSTQTLQARILKSIEGLASEVQLDEARLAQEVAVLSVKADICEELDRLDAHIIAARALLAENGPIGRKFDFLVQEFNRETNTLCSKAVDITLKQAGLEMKTIIDQMREQVQNVE